MELLPLMTLLKELVTFLPSPQKGATTNCIPTILAISESQLGFELVTHQTKTRESSNPSQ